MSQYDFTQIYLNTLSWSCTNCTDGPDDVETAKHAYLGSTEGMKQLDAKPRIERKLCSSSVTPFFKIQPNSFPILNSLNTASSLKVKILINMSQSFLLLTPSGLVTLSDMCNVSVSLSILRHNPLSAFFTTMTSSSSHSMTRNFSLLKW